VEKRNAQEEGEREEGGTEVGGYLLRAPENQALRLPRGNRRKMIPSTFPKLTVTK